MAIEEAQIEQIFRTLGEHFIKIHYPAINQFWSSVMGDMTSSEQALVGEDISELLQHVDTLHGAMAPLMAAINGAGPKLVSHADSLARAFGALGAAMGGAGSGAGSSAGGGSNDPLSNPAILAGLSGFLGGGVLASAGGWGSVLNGLKSWSGGISSVAGLGADLRFLSPFTSDGLGLWDTGTSLITKLPNVMSGPILSGLKSLMASNLGGDLAGFGDSVAKFAGPIGIAAAGIQTGDAAYNLITQGVNYNTAEGALSAVANDALQTHTPMGLVAWAGINAGEFGSNALWNAFPNQMEAAHEFAVGIPGDLATGGSDAVQGVEDAWNAGSKAVSDVTSTVSNAASGAWQDITHPFGL